MTDTEGVPQRTRCVAHRFDTIHGRTHIRLSGFADVDGSTFAIVEDPEMVREDVLFDRWSEAETWANTYRAEHEINTERGAAHVEAAHGRLSVPGIKTGV